MLNRQSKTLLAAAVAMLFTASAFAQQAQQAPASGNPAMQLAQEPSRPVNPLEEMSRLNAELATLKAKLAVTDVKSQIKKKEDEMAPPKAEAKPSAKAAAMVVREERAPLPPLPNISNLPKGLEIGVPPAAEKPDMAPQVVAIEGMGGELYAEIQSDWGGYARVQADGMYHGYKIIEITKDAVRAKDPKGKAVQLSVQTTAVQRLQAGNAAPANGMGMGSPMSAPFASPMLPPPVMSNPVTPTRMPVIPTSNGGVLRTPPRSN